MIAAEEGAVARAVVWVDERGRLNVVARGYMRSADGRRVKLRRRLIVPNGDRALAEDVARQLNVAFAMRDLSWLLDGTAKRETRRAAFERPRRIGATFSEWAKRWLDTYKPPLVSKRTYDNYRYAVDDLTDRFRGRPLAEIDAGAVINLRSELTEADLRPRTIGDRLAVLRLILRDARVHGLVSVSPFDGLLPKRRTKIEKVRMARKVEFRPFTVSELETLAAVLRRPRDERELLYFPPTEVMLLTGLRWGEAAGIIWPDVSWAGRRVHVRRAVVRGQDDPNEPTKTAAKWAITMRPPLERLLLHQKKRTFVGRTEDRIFPGPKNRPISYAEWLRKGWDVALRRAEVAPREGDAQKALRRSYVTSSLVCGRNPKEVSGELGHATTRMIVDVYDSFLDPTSWPDEKERARLCNVYGWKGGTHGGTLAHPGDANEKAPSAK